ncbi:hypothetical protein [Porticoccus sp.]
MTAPLRVVDSGKEYVKKADEPEFGDGDDGEEVERVICQCEFPMWLLYTDTTARCAGCTQEYWLSELLGLDMLEDE